MAKAKVDKIKAAAKFIEAYYEQPIKLGDIAYEASLSVSRLAHLFKEQMQVTPIEYLTNIRIERAKKILLTTDKKCCNIYYEVGYNSQTYFARKFKGVVGLSPSQFRQKNRVKSQ
jgi:YesN/AraC family two-component response regulator